MLQIAGHHHISMITKNAQQNHRFYNEILGMRRVKKTVNQDDPSMYHLFYGDMTGSPGTELTFLSFHQSAEHIVARTPLRVSDYSFLRWKVFIIGESDFPSMVCPMVS